MKKEKNIYMYIVNVYDVREFSQIGQKITKLLIHSL